MRSPFRHHPLPAAGWSRLALALALASLLAGWPARPRAEDSTPSSAGLAIEGSWYVLIHYRTRVDGEPGEREWDDRVWRFQPRAGGLLWSELPTPLFRDESGRYREVESGRSARTLGFWQPNPGQLEEIRRGLSVSRQGARSKALRGSRRAGYRSSRTLRGSSASVIGYHESWRIEALFGSPRFLQEAEMASARADAARGETRFEVQEILGGGEELRGRYERDGVIEGSFRMLRMEGRDER